MKESKEPIQKQIGIEEEDIPIKDEEIGIDPEKAEQEMKDYQKYLENIEEIRPSMVRWISAEVAPKMAIIEELSYSSRLSDYRKEILQLSVTPLHYFLEKEDTPISDKQINFLYDLADKNPKRFYAWSNQREDVTIQGDFGVVIPQLNKEQATQCIGWMLRQMDIDGNKREGSK